MKKITLLSDTHSFLDERILPYIKNSDEVWHAGDIGSIEIMDKISTFSKFRGVYGNIDNYKIQIELDKVLIFKCEEVKVIITHIGGSPYKYNKEVNKLIKTYKPNLFICGHSHILKIQYDKNNKLIYMNPGSCGNSGIHISKTIILFNIDKKKIFDVRVIEFTKKLTNSINRFN